MLTKTSNASTRLAISEKLGSYLTNCISARFGEALYKSANSIKSGPAYPISTDAERNILQLRQDYMQRARDCIKDNTTLEITQTLIAASTRWGNTK